MILSALQYGVIKMSEMFSGGLPGSIGFETEMDVYIDELYEPYSELFEWLFTKFRKFHLSRSSNSFQDYLSLVRVVDFFKFYKEFFVFDL